ncbi:MAG TPA: hypothetical protein VLL97_02930 [Acidobacteriota bacterium]|nr:hypothetical protein [Acidobacteriota bacterium]
MQEEKIITVATVNPVMPGNNDGDRPQIGEFERCEGAGGRFFYNLMNNPG